MKQIVFLAHDPGGYDVIYPTFSEVKKLDHNKVNSLLICTGASGKINREYSMSCIDAKNMLKHKLSHNEVALLVTGTSWGDFTEVECIEICKENMIPTISILDYWSNYKMRFKIDKNKYIFPDYYLVMDKLAKQEAINDGVPENILRVVGHPGLDKFKVLKEYRKINDSEKRTALFLSQPLSVLYGISLGYNEDIVMRDLIKLSKCYNVDLKVKFHPKDDDGFKERYNIYKMDGKLTEIMAQFDVVIGMNTMGLLHAALMNIPIVSYQPGLCVKDCCITNKIGMTKCITSYKAMEFLYRNKFCVKDNKLIDNIIWLDGKSAKRSKEFIVGVLP